MVEKTLSSGQAKPVTKLDPATVAQLIHDHSSLDKKVDICQAKVSELVARVSAIEAGSNGSNFSSPQTMKQPISNAPDPDDA